MKKQLREVLFLAIFGFLCTLFVFFVPWGGDKGDVVDENIKLEGDSIALETGEQQILLTHFEDTLRIVLKDGMDTKNLQMFVDEFTDKYGGNIEFIRVSNPEDWSELKDIDLMLVPYDYIENLQFQEIAFQEDISPLFISQLQEFVQIHPEFLPFGFDISGIYALEQIDGLDDFLEYANTWSPIRSIGVFNFNISDNPLLYDENIILTYQIQDFLDYNNVGGFKSWIDFTSSSQENQDKLVTLIQNSSLLCKNTPLICLVEKKLLAVAWGFSSDISKGNLVFSENPYNDRKSLGRLYGFVLPKGSQHESMALQFLLDYMDLAFSEREEALAVSSRLIPVFKNEFSTICGTAQCGLTSELTIIEKGSSKINQFLNDALYRKVVKKIINPEAYLR